jgi:beta-lactamase superfamily II metal-dependent hydrolase
MLFSLDVLRARKGDCLMLHYGSADKPRLMLIDGGPSNVYKPHLKPRLLEIHQSRGLEKEDPLPADVVMVSHLDDDHIKGILDLTKEQCSDPDVRLQVDSLWHNSFDDLLKTRPTELKVEGGFGAAAVDSSGDSGSALASIGQNALASDQLRNKDEIQSAKVLASIPQGRQLRDDAKVLGWKANRGFKNKLILATQATKEIELKGGLKVTVVGPMQSEVLALQEVHDKWLRNQEKKRKTPPEAALAAFADKSVPNLSSIVVMVESGGKRMLLTGDARGDKILEGLELVRLLEKGGNTRVDVLKVPHHGSDNNMAPVFFERVLADHYVFSGNGEHGNPERETLKMLLDARGNADYEVHLTYPADEIDVERKKDWEKEQARERKKKKVNVRADWLPKKNGLASFFADNKGMAKKVRIVEDGKPHLINLLHPVTYLRGAL